MSEIQFLQPQNIRKDIFSNHQQTTQQFLAQSYRLEISETIQEYFLAQLYNVQPQNF